MKNVDTRRRQKVVLITSLLLNGVLIAGIATVVIVSKSSSDTSRIRAFQEYYCQERYDALLHEFDGMYDTEHAAQAKNVYAMTVCLKNYKTGQPLDLTPLQKQVDETPSPL